MRMPALFIGHGSPMNLIEDNDYTRLWASLPARFPRPTAILCISAHWETKGVLITAAEHQRTIHDFYNFPEALYRMTYPAPGAPELARRIETMLAPYARADLDGWGLDHGAWSVLARMYPEADIPMIQLSLDLRRTAADHYALGRQLAVLRDEGVLILGSGNIVHNLRYFRVATAPFDWAVAFDAAARKAILTRDHQALIDYRELTPGAELAVPEPEHYHPLLYSLGAADETEPIEILCDGVMVSVSMTSVGIGL